MNNVEQLVGSYLMECFVNRVEPDFGGEAQRLSVIERILKDREELEEEIETYESVIDGVVGHRVID
jgi:pentose-5-phosphate-3-epimerase